VSRQQIRHRVARSASPTRFPRFFPRSHRCHSRILFKLVPFIG
jgi:hypothetical protein